LNLPNFKNQKGDYKMKTPKEFDYDLWTTGEETSKQYWVRVKRTGDVSEVNAEILRFLRNEEKKLRREYARYASPNAEESGDTSLPLCPLSLDALLADEECDEAYWLTDRTDNENNTIAKMLEAEFRGCLTDFQLDVYEKCVLGGASLRAFSRERCLNFKTVFEARDAIQKKAKVFF